MELSEYLYLKRMNAIPRIKEMKTAHGILLLFDYLAMEFSRDKQLSRLSCYYEVNKERASLAIYRGSFDRSSGKGAYSRLVLLHYTVNEEGLISYEGFSFSDSISEKNAPNLKKKLKRTLETILNSYFPDSFAPSLDKNDLAL